MRGFVGDRAFLSNFDITPFSIDGLEVKSAEHAFNASKALNDIEREYVLAAETPREAKRRGRGINIRPGWDEGLRVACMQEVLGHKFRDPDLRARLLTTGTELLVEVNYWHDQFWGDCVCKVHAGTAGKNMLGELLMALRATLSHNS